MLLRLPPECFRPRNFAVVIRKHLDEPVKALVRRQLRGCERLRFLSAQEAPKLLGVYAATNRLVDPLMKHEVIFDLYAEVVLIGVLWAKVAVASAIQRRPMGCDISRPQNLPEQRQRFSMVIVSGVVDAVGSPRIAENLFSDDLKSLSRPDEVFSAMQLRVCHRSI